MPCTRHRVFLATLIAAAKYLNDSSPKNKHWTRYAVLFDCAEINLMERQLLCLLNFDLRFSEEDACSHWDYFLPKRQAEDMETRKMALDKIKARRTKSANDAVHASSTTSGAYNLKKQPMQLPPTPPYDVVSHPKKPEAPTRDEEQRSSIINVCDSKNHSPVMTSSSPMAIESHPSMDALTEDNGSSSESDTGSATSDSGHAGSAATFEDQLHRNKDGFILQPVPISAYRIGKGKASASADSKLDSGKRTSAVQSILMDTSSPMSTLGPSPASPPHVSFVLPPRPDPIRATCSSSAILNMSSSQYGSKASSHGTDCHRSQSSSGAQGLKASSTTSSIALSALPKMSLRESVSNSFLSRMFGVGGGKNAHGSEKERQREKSNGKTHDTVDDSMCVDGNVLVIAV